MAIQTTANLTNSLKAVYGNKYIEGWEEARLYDQIAVDYTRFVPGVSMQDLMRSSSIVVPFISVMSPGTTAISETADVTPQTLRDATASITWTSRGEALQWSQQLSIEVYTDYTARAYKAVGKNAGESVELLAQAAACQGSWVERAAARASLDAGTASHRASDSIFRKYAAKFGALRAPGFLDDQGNATNSYAAIMHDYLFHDISESGNVNAIGVMQDKGIHLNFELGSIGPFKLVVSPYAKVFGAAGADNATNVATTLNGAANALGTTFVTAADNSANISYGEYWWIGTEETANTFYPTNEPVKPLSASTVTVTALGRAENGGLLYDHASGVAVRNADSVYTIVFAGPESLVKVYAVETGMYGSTVGPKTSGTLDQFNSLGWKYYGNYARFRENSVLRGEFSTSYEA